MIVRVEAPALLEQVGVGVLSASELLVVIVLTRIQH